MSSGLGTPPRRVFVISWFDNGRNFHQEFLCMCIWLEIPGLSTTEGSTRNDDMELPGLLLDGIVYKVKRKQNLNIMHIGYDIFNAGRIYGNLQVISDKYSTHGYKQ